MQLLFILSQPEKLIGGSPLAFSIFLYYSQHTISG